MKNKVLQQIILIFLGIVIFWLCAWYWYFSFLGCGYAFFVFLFTNRVSFKSPITQSFPNYFTFINKLVAGLLLFYSFVILAFTYLEWLIQML